MNIHFFAYYTGYLYDVEMYKTETVNKNLAILHVLCYYVDNDKQYFLKTRPRINTERA